MPRTSVTSDVFIAIAEPRRRQIIDLLARRSGLATQSRGMPVGEIVGAMRLPQPAVSKHLSVLRGVGVVSVVKQGQHRLYELNVERLQPVRDWLKMLDRHYERQLDRIRARAEQRAVAITNKPGKAPGAKGAS